MNDFEFITLTAGDLGSARMLCGHSPRYRRGYAAKIEWMQDRLREGMRYTMVWRQGSPAGMIETIPAEAAWRAVDAGGYLFIHCFWVVGRNRGLGIGRRLLEDCLGHARGMNGVVVVVSKAHWLPTPKLFLKNGFELADHADPSFDLLVKRFKADAPLPRFRVFAGTIPPGLTLYTSDQCPYTQNVADIVTRVGAALELPVNVIHVENARLAQSCPSVVGTLAYFFNGKFLTHHPLRAEELMNILKPARIDRGKIEAV